MNDRCYKVAKHIKMKYLSLKKEVHKWWMSNEHISMSVNIVDPIHEGLSPKTFIKHAKGINIGYS